MKRLFIRAIKSSYTMKLFFVVVPNDAKFNLIIITYNILQLGSVCDYNLLFLLITSSLFHIFIFSSFFSSFIFYQYNKYLIRDKY